MATTTATGILSAREVFDSALLIVQVRRFLWLSSGMFSTSSLAIAFLDFFASGSYAQAGTHFLAAVAAAGLFGLATLLKLGPVEA